MDLIANFGLGTYDNLVGQLTKLRQTSTVRLYQDSLKHWWLELKDYQNIFFCAILCKQIERCHKKSGSYVLTENTSSSSWVGLISREYFRGNDQRSQGFNKIKILPFNPYNRIKTQFYGTNSSNQKNIYCRNTRGWTRSFAIITMRRLN